MNLVFLIPGETGGRETYVRELVAAMLHERPQMRVTAFVNRETARSGERPWGDAARCVEVPVRARSRPQWAFGEQVLLPRVARRERIDVLFSPANTAPATGAFARATTVHDVMYARFPQLLSRAALTGTRVLVPLGARRSHRVLTGSEAARRDLVEVIGLRAQDIDVVPHGLGTPAPEQRPDGGPMRVRLAIAGRRLVFCPAIAIPHKNLPALADGVLAMPADRRPVLVLAGKGTDRDPALVRRRAADPHHLRLLGRVGTEDLEALYAAADCVAMPTLHEGFGLPVVEAMARGVPVACSDIAVLREVAGDAVAYFDPHAAASIAATLESVLDNPERAAALRAGGRKRAERYTWPAAARSTLQSIDRALLSAS